MILVLVALGFLPFALGGLMNRLMMLNSYWFPNYVYLAVAILTLLLWAALAYLIKPYIKSTKKVILGLHVIPAVVLLLLGIQELVLHQYWPNFFGLLTQIYYLPLIRIGSLLTSWFGTTVFLCSCVAFLLMISAAFIGCKLRRK